MPNRKGGFGEILLGISGFICLATCTWMRTRAGNFLSQQGFIALWCNQAVRGKVSDTIEGAISDAGYTPRRIDRDLSTSSIPDQVVHQLRQSRFVVADLTSHLLAGNDERGRGNVYYEADFAAGADLEVLFTCRKNCYDEKKVASDIRHFHVVRWDAQGWSQRAIAKEFGLSRGAVENVLRRGGL